MRILEEQRNTLLFLLCLVALSGVIAEESKKEVNRDEVKHHHRRGISKTIQMEDGDIFDCIDIKSQPAFDHPLLRNHSVQMAPSSYPMDLDGSTKLPDTELESSVSPVSCPSGTIPIWRNEQQHPKVNMKEVIRKIYTRNTTQNGEQISLLAGLSRREEIYGTRASINVYETKIYGVDDRSGAVATIINVYKQQSNAVSVGWFMWQGAGGDKAARFHIHYENGHNNCFDLQCSGFVQINPNIPLGGRLRPVSKYDGRQAEMHITLFQDSKSNWWVTLSKDNVKVGYWPAELFTFLRARGVIGYWGGVVEGPTVKNRPPPMGSGHFAFEGYGRAAYVKSIKVLSEDRQLVNPPAREFDEYSDSPRCYTVGNKERGEQNGMYANFGGPGDCRL